MRVLIIEKISNNRFKDGNGYLIISNNVIARTGKQIYKHNQVYDNSEDAYTDVEVDRPEIEVFSPETIASFENKPVTILHPDEKVSSYNHSELAKGFFREIRRGMAINPETGIEEPVLMGTAVITNQDAIEDVESGRWTHWSCGYDTEIIQSENPYQTKIRGNHIALCTSPRAGKIAAISDEESSKEVYVPHFIQVLTDALDSDDIQWDDFGLNVTKSQADELARKYNSKVIEYKVHSNGEMKVVFKGPKEMYRKYRREIMKVKDSFDSDDIKSNATRIIEKLGFGKNSHTVSGNQLIWTIGSGHEKNKVIRELKKHGISSSDYKSTKSLSAAEIVVYLEDSVKDSLYNQYLVQYFVFKNGKKERKEAMIFNIGESDVYNQIIKKLALIEKVHSMYIDLENISFKKGSSSRQIETIDEKKINDSKYNVNTASLKGPYGQSLYDLLNTTRGMSRSVAYSKFNDILDKCDFDENEFIKEINNSNFMKYDVQFYKKSTNEIQLITKHDRNGNQHILKIVKN